MLNGLDPIIIFQFSKKVPEVTELLAKIPLVSDIPTLVDQPPIPIYLSENLTGLFIDAESKSIDASTQIETKSDGSEVSVNQKGIASIVSIDMLANKNSLGLALIAAMADQVLERMSSKEYFITYLHGSTTVFRGLLHSYSMNQTADDDLLRIRIELSRGDSKNLPNETPQKLPTLNRSTGTTPIN